MKLRELKEKIPSIALIVFNCMAILVILAVATFAWIPNTVRRAKHVTYESNLLISSLEIDIYFECYDPTLIDINTGKLGCYVPICTFENGETITNEGNEDFIIRLNPSENMSYRFKVHNRSLTSGLTSDIIFEDFKATYDPDVHDDENGEDIFDYLSINIVEPKTYEIPKLSTGFTTSYSNKKNLLFYEDFTIPAGETISINWYIGLSADAGNEFWGTKISFESIYFGI